MVRQLQLPMVAVATFAIIRLIDHLVVPRDFGLSSRAGTAYVASQQQQQHAPCPTVMPASATAAPLPVVGAASAAPPRRRREPHFAIIGFPVGIDERNRARRQLLRRRGRTRKRGGSIGRARRAARRETVLVKIWDTIAQRRIACVCSV